MKQSAGRRGELLKELAGFDKQTSVRRPVRGQESECRQETRILTLLVFSSAGRWSRQDVMLKKVSTQSFACICAHSVSATGTLYGFGQIKVRSKLFFMRI